MANKPTGFNTSSLVDRVMPSNQRLVIAFMSVLLAFGMLLLSVVAVFTHLLDDQGDKKVKVVQDGGHVQLVQLVNGPLMRSLVQTDIGFYALRDGVSLTKGETVTLETRDNNRRYLCDAQRRCTQLM